jgi:hypothetical protein
MKSKLIIFFLVLLSPVLVSSSLFAQLAEINPYAGFYWPGSTGEFDSFQNNQLIGVRGGYYLTSHIEVGGNYGWSNHFQPKNAAPPSAFAGDLGFPQGKVRANIWEGEFTYNFGKRSFMGATLKPYLVGGLGGLTTSVSSPNAFVLTVRPVVQPSGDVTYVTKDVLGSSDTFLTFSYGGGVKTDRIWGPMGFFGDIRGRAVPNFFSSTFNWPELSAGLTFSWGER